MGKNTATTAEGFELDLAAQKAAEEAAAKKAAEDAKVKAEAEEKTERARVRAILDQAAKEAAAGNSAAVWHYFEAGRLCHEYLRAMMAREPKAARAMRADGTKAIADKLAPYVDGMDNANDVNDFIRAYYAFARLTEGRSELVGTKRKPGHALGVAFTTWVNVWAQLVVRTGNDTPQEDFVLLRGHEEECKKLFADYCTTDMTLVMVKATITRLAKAAADEEAQAAAEMARKQAAEAAAALEAQQKALADVAKAAADQAKLLAEAGKAKDEGEKSKLLEAAAKAKEDMLAKQAAQNLANAEAEAKERARRKAEQDAEFARKQAEKLERQRKKEADREAGIKSSVSRPTAPAAGAAATPDKLDTKDPVQAAAMMVEQLTAMSAWRERPSDVLLAVLSKLGGSKELSAKDKRAIKAAILALAGTTPTELVQAVWPTVSEVRAWCQKTGGQVVEFTK